MSVIERSAVDTDTVLSVTDLAVHYGGVKAIDGVDLQVERGSVIGLIGANGAGKTTLFECIAGFTTPNRGVVHFDGIDVTHLKPERRGELGLIRSFQDARLFPSLTVHQTVKASLERDRPSRLFESVLSLPRERRAERAKDQRADELIESMGLVTYRDKFIGELSTGTRRIVELACVLALDPTLLLLDEPSSGIAQRESEALGPVLRRVQALTSCTMLVIEHDMPLILGLADHLVAMESGRVIARGLPHDVVRDPAVVASYLGNDGVAVARSGTDAGGALRPAEHEPEAQPEPTPEPAAVEAEDDGRCTAPTRSGDRCKNRARDGARTCGIPSHRNSTPDRPNPQETP